jgi:hypothetical protein
MMYLVPFLPSFRSLKASMQSGWTESLNVVSEVGIETQPDAG